MAVVDEAKMPILVACGQVVNRSDDPEGPSPLEMIAAAVREAEQDSGCAALLTQLSDLAAVGLTVDAPGIPTPFKGNFANVPKTLTKILGITPSRMHYAAIGGNTPQALVNHFANEIAQGRSGTVLLAGGEALHTMSKRFNKWYKLLWPRGRWSDKPGGKALAFGDTRTSTTKDEASYGLDMPANAYPLFENALQAHYQRSHKEHMESIGRIYNGFSKVAEQNPYAWFPKARSADELITPNKENRIIAYPYTKRLNSMIMVNQAAAVVLTSVAQAKALGISSDKWVYLHGCADANDIWNITERANYHSSPAIRKVGQEALAMAGRSIDEIDFFDIYSCFPSAVQITCDELGIKHDDPRGLSLTGGMPYFGGPGNNYSMHAIAEMIQRARQNPSQFGLMNTNGWHLTKHAIGIYSAKPLEKPWHRTGPSSYQTEILEQQSPRYVEQADGEATIETFTVIHDRKNEPKRGIVIGRLDSKERFLAELSGDVKSMRRLMDEGGVGIKGRVYRGKKQNQFEF